MMEKSKTLFFQDVGVKIYLVQTVLPNPRKIVFPNAKISAAKLMSNAHSTLSLGYKNDTYRSMWAKKRMQKFMKSIFEKRYANK